MDKQISSFALAESFEDDDRLLVSQAGATKTVTGKQVKDLAAAGAKGFADAARESARAAKEAEENTQDAGNQAASAIAAAKRAEAAAGHVDAVIDDAAGAVREEFAGLTERAETACTNAEKFAQEAKNAAGGGVTSFNGRTGTVTPQAGDYTADDVGAVAMPDKTAATAGQVPTVQSDGTVLWQDQQVTLSDEQKAELKGEPGNDGKSPYQIAVENGFTGTETEWVESLRGTDGKSPYDIAKAGGYSGTESEFNALLIALGTAGFPLPIAQGGTGKNTAPLGLYALINGSTALTSTGIATGDYFAVGDVSAATGKKITLANLKTALGVDSSGGIVIGTYEGQQTKPSANSSAQQTTQTITLGFQPKFVWVGRIGNSKGVNIIPWYEQQYFLYPSSERSYNYEFYASSAYAIPNHPYKADQGKYSYSSGNGDEAEVNVLEITSNGFIVGNARYTDDDTTLSPEENTDKQAYLNYSGYTYFYLAVK